MAYLSSTRPFVLTVLLFMLPLSYVTLFLVPEMQSPPGTTHLSAQLHGVSRFQRPITLFWTRFRQGALILWLSLFLSLPPFLFFVFVSVNQLVSLSVTSFYSAHMYGTHIHIAQIPLGKLLSLPMNSAMLLLSLDPKGNIMNNEQSSERSGWGSRMRRWAAWEGERPFRTRTRWRDGGEGCNLLVFTHQLGHRGDMKRMEGDVSWTTGRGGGGWGEGP